MSAILLSLAYVAWIGACFITGMWAGRAMAKGKFWPILYWSGWVIYEVAFQDQEVVAWVFAPIFSVMLGVSWVSWVCKRDEHPPTGDNPV